MTNTLANGYNIVPLTATLPDAPIAQPERKPRTMTMFFCGLQWLIISVIVFWIGGILNSDRTELIGGFAAVLSAALAALGLVWGAFQHVLRTIVRIVRHGS